jgi:hypothetical protein
MSAPRTGEERASYVAELRGISSSASSLEVYWPAADLLSHDDAKKTWEWCRKLAALTTSLKAEAAEFEENIEKHESNIQTAKARIEQWRQGYITVNGIALNHEDELDSTGEPVITPAMREYVRFIVLRCLLELAGLGGMEGLLVDANALMDAYEDRIRLVEQAEGMVEEIGDNEAAMSQVQEELVKEILMGIIAVEVRIQEHADEAWLRSSKNSLQNRARRWYRFSQD